MIPDNLLGLLLFLSGIGPGYVFLRVAERREPRQVRSTLLEFAELFVIGAATTAGAAVLVLLVGELTHTLDLRKWLTQGRAYVLAEPARTLVAVGAVLVLSYVGAWGLARLLHRGRPASIRPQSSVWFQMFHVADASVTTGALRFATVELKDGRRVGGYVHAYTVNPDAEGRELCLRAPLFSQPNPQSKSVLLRDEFIILPANEILYVSVQVQDAPAVK